MNEDWPKPGGVRLVALCVASVPLMMAGAATGRPALVTLTAAGVTLAITATAAMLASRSGQYRSSSVDGSPAGRRGCARSRAAAMQATRLAIVAYGWGAVAMQSLYLTQLTGLRWQHGWEYALAMAVLCAGSVFFARRLGSNRWRPAQALAMPLATGQALVAAGGLVFLIVSGKLGSVRPDWAANRVFVALAVAILAVALAGMVAARRADGPHSKASP